MELKLSPKELLALHDLLRSRGQHPDEEHLAQVYGKVRAYLIGSLDRSEADKRPDPVQFQRWLDKEQAKVDALSEGLKKATDAWAPQLPSPSIDEMFAAADAADAGDAYPRRSVHKGPGPGKYRGHKR